MDGILNVYKERGYTSHDVVAKLRGILHMRRIGHTGTLDPEAEGVLPVCIGQATRLCELLTDKEKEYRAVMLLGVTTDTQDMSGTVITSRPVDVAETEIREVLSSFIGEYEQTPPMYSALKVDGKPLYQLARQGITVERKSRTVRIISLEIEEIALPRVAFRVVCSKGTYIRTLCDDAGRKLGCGAAMESLVRTRSGQFLLADSLRLDQIRAYQEQNDLAAHLLPLDAMFLHLTRAVVMEDGEKLLYNGNPLPENVLQFLAPAGEKISVYDRTGRFIGCYRYDAKNGLYRPEILFLGKG